MDQYLRVDQWQKRSEKESKQKQEEKLKAFEIEIDKNLRFQQGEHNSQQISPTKVGPLYSLPPLRE